MPFFALPAISPRPGAPLGPPAHAILGLTLPIHRMVPGQADALPRHAAGEPAARVAGRDAAGAPGVLGSSQLLVALWLFRRSRKARSFQVCTPYIKK